MFTNTATYDFRTAFAMSLHVNCLWESRFSPRRCTGGVAKNVGTCGAAGIQPPSCPVVRRVSNIPRTLSTRSANPPSSAMSSATRSREWITVE
jgi:hypothetical protein